MPLFSRVSLAEQFNLQHIMYVNAISIVVMITCVNIVVIVITNQRNKKRGEPRDGWRCVDRKAVLLLERSAIASSGV